MISIPAIPAQLVPFSDVVPVQLQCISSAVLEQPTILGPRRGAR